MSAFNAESFASNFEAVGYGIAGVIAQDRADRIADQAVARQIHAEAGRIRAATAVIKASTAARRQAALARGRAIRARRG